MHDVMIDIEALSTQLGAVVLSLGAPIHRGGAGKSRLPGLFPGASPGQMAGRLGNQHGLSNPG